MTEKRTPCCCGSTDLKELKPYGIESVQCRDCHVSLRKQDWSRVMGSNVPEGYALVPVEPSTLMREAWRKHRQESDLSAPDQHHAQRCEEGVM